MAKKKTGRSSAASGARRSGRRSTGRAAAVRAPKPSGHELVPVTCSECFEELAYDTGVASDTLECPVCEHTADKPDDGLLHRISGHRRTEKMNFLLASGVMGVGLLAFAVWGLLIKDPANVADSGMFFGPLALALLSALGLVVLTVRYESNRWEFYF